MIRQMLVLGLAVLLGFHSSSNCISAEMKAGFAQVDITPTAATPMWGYGARHAALSTGTRDVLQAKAVVIDAGSDKLAIVGLDLGRGPTEGMMVRIRQAVAEKAGVKHLMISGSHTHHGPVIELLDEVGKGKDAYAGAVSYATELENKLIDVIVMAATRTQPAKIGWASQAVPLNRNRHTKIEPKPVDSELAVIRLDDAEGKTLGLIVNFAAHATMLDGADLRFSGDWPAQMTQAVEKQLGAPCVFMQGTAGDLSPAAPEDAKTVELFGQRMAGHVVDVQRTIETKAIRRARIDVREETFDFATRIPLGNPAMLEVFSQAFFPELAAASVTEDLKNNRIKPKLITVLLNRQLALVGGSGEFFCEHGLRLKERSRADKTLFFGYCNGHHMYFPTIQAVAEGGYGADSAVSWVAVGAGEEMMNHALIAIYTMLGKITE